MGVESSSLLQSNWTRRSLGITLAGLTGTVLIGTGRVLQEGTRPINVQKKPAPPEPTPVPVPTAIPEIEARYFGQPIVPSTKYPGEYDLVDTPPTPHGIVISPLHAHIDPYSREQTNFFMDVHPSTFLNSALGFLTPDSNSGKQYFFFFDKSGSNTSLTTSGNKVYLPPFAVFDAFRKELCSQELLVHTDDGQVLIGGEWEKVTDARPSSSPLPNAKDIFVPSIFYDPSLSAWLTEQAARAGYGEYINEIFSHMDDATMPQYKVTPKPVIREGTLRATDIVVNPSTNKIDTRGGIVLLSQPDPNKIVDVVDSSRFDPNVAFADVFGAPCSVQYPGLTGGAMQDIKVFAKDGQTWNWGSLYKQLMFPTGERVTEKGVPVNYNLFVFAAQVDTRKLNLTPRG